MISLAGTQICEYTNDRCEGFFCLRVFIHVFGLCEIVFFGPGCADAQIFVTKWPIFYLCTCIFLFVAQINPPLGTFVCCTNRRPEYTNRALSLSSTEISPPARYLPSLPLALSCSYLWVFGTPWTPLLLAMLSLPSGHRACVRCRWFACLEGQKLRDQKIEGWGVPGP